MKFKRKSLATPQIPGASLSDIVFSLLLFFMVTTVVKKYTGIPVELPEAGQIEKLQTKTHTSYIWLDEAGNISFDDYPVSSPDDIYNIARAKIEKDKQLLIFLRADKNLRMGALADVQQELRKAGALRIYYGTKTKAVSEY